MTQTEEFMARRSKADGPGLFGDDPAGLNAYGKPVEATIEARASGEPGPPRKVAELRPVVAAIAAEVIAEARASFGVSGDAIDRVERLERAVRRAIQLIQPTAGSFVGTDPMRALAVLRECLLPEPDTKEEFACSQSQS
jgi:hypothetical protein